MIGLPFAVNLSYDFSIKKKKDKNIVRHLQVYETMRGVTIINSDKTGMQTQNRKTVVKFFIDDGEQG
jgi:magnesium-transporting ATPase (P-type)